MSNVKYLEVHRYGPEMNKIHFKKGGYLSVGGLFSIAEVRKKYLEPKPKGLRVVVMSTYEDKKWHYLNKVVAGGLVESRLKALEYSKQFQQEGGKLKNGEVLPPNKLKFKFYY